MYNIYKYMWNSTSRTSLMLQKATQKSDKCANFCFAKFNVLLTVHHAMILGNCPT